MPHWRTLQDRDFIGAADIEGRGDVTVTIKRVEQGVVARAGTPKKERKPVIVFDGRDGEKRWIVSSTNGKTIESLYGTDYLGWPGKRVTLYTTQTRSPSDGKPCLGIRVRPKVPGSKTPDAVPEQDQTAPVVQAELSGKTTDGTPDASA